MLHPRSGLVMSSVATLLAATTTLAGQQSPARPTLLQVASLVAPERVKVGERFTLTLQLTPAGKMHVYAPTVVNYKPIALTVRPQPGLIIRRLSYPPAEKYFYAPLKETVDVYQKSFEVKQELALDPSPAGRAALKGVSTLTVRGTLSYQACDDKVCYPPRTVPMTWTVGIKES
jgi:cytochrome c biogenesis DsbD-like protein